MADNEKDIIQVLNAQDAAWNHRVLPSFMEAYHYSPNTLYVSGKSYKYGWSEIRSHYQKEYFHDGSNIGQLSTKIIDIKVVSPEVAIVCGSWHLKAFSGSKSEGIFTLVMQKIDGQWKITHDHSS